MPHRTRNPADQPKPRWPIEATLPADLMEHLVVLPTQFTTRFPRKMHGVRNLMAAVLTDGIESYRTNRRSAGRSERQIHAEASEWIFSDDLSFPFSFLNLCDALDVDSVAIRERLRRREHPRRG